MRNFTTKEVVLDRKYRVPGIFPCGTHSFILSQSGVGKSRLVCHIAAGLSIGTEALGRKVEACKVFLINQDQSQDASNRYMAETLRYFRVESPPNLYVSFQEDNLQLKDGSLIKAINELNPDVVIIDTLSSVSARLDLCKPSDAQHFRFLYSQCNNKDICLITTHHITDKRVFTYNDFLTCLPNDLAMYSSVFTQSVDGYFVLYNPEVGKNINHLFIRAITKRYQVDFQYGHTGMVQENGATHFLPLTPVSLDDSEALNQVEGKIVCLFEDHEHMVVQQALLDLKGEIGINKIQIAFNILTEKGILHRVVLGHNKGEFYLTDKGRKVLDKIRIAEGNTPEISKILNPNKDGE